MRLAHCILLAGFISAPLYANPLNGFSFAHKDWEVACDNTGTCRAAGYSDHAVSVLLTRAAGPDTSVYVEVAFAQRTASQPSVKDATLFIDGQKQGALTFSAEGYFKLNYQQRKVFLDALRQDNTIEFAANSERLPLSNAGSSAVLLKMDEFQKRIIPKALCCIQEIKTVMMCLTLSLPHLSSPTPSSARRTWNR